MSVLNKLFLFCILLGILCNACKKKDSLPPVLDSDAQFEIISPADDSYLPLNGTIKITAAIKGGLTDYSFMEVYLLNAGTNDTLHKSTVNKDGSVFMNWVSNLQPGKYLIKLVAVNSLNKSEVIETTHRGISVCLPPKPTITNAIADDSSITLQWAKDTSGDFKSYEIYVSRTDTAADRAPFPDGNLIATITDVNTTSFKHNNVYFYYSYSYKVKTITTGNCESNSDRFVKKAGIYFEFPSGTVTGNVLFNKTSNLMYYYRREDNLSKIKIISPVDLTDRGEVQFNDQVSFLGEDETGNKLNIITKPNVNVHQIVQVDGVNSSITSSSQFNIDPNPISINGLFQKLIVYNSFSPSLPRYQYLAAYDTATSLSTVIRVGNIDKLVSVDNNAAFIVTYEDSFFVYDVIANSIHLRQKGKSINLRSGAGTGIYSSSNSYGMGRNLYDKSFNLLFSLGNEGYFTGLSYDGKWAVDNLNQVYNTTNFTIVKKYGDGFGTNAWFSTGTNMLYQLTEGSLNPKWNPPPRLYRMKF